MPNKKARKNENDSSFVRMTLNLERVKVELAGNSAEKCLREVNRILDKVLHITSNDFMFDGLNGILSEELIQNSTVTKLINNYSQIYEEYRTNRVSIENKQVVELEKGKVQSLIDFNDVKKNVHRLLLPIDVKAVKNAVIHVKGSLPAEEAKKITDLLAQELQHSEIHTVCTKSEVSSHTIVEGIFFGNFEPEYEDD